MNVGMNVGWNQQRVIQLYGLVYSVLASLRDLKTQPQQI